MAKSAQQLEGTFSVDEVHKLIGTDNVSKIAIYDACRAGTIPSIRIGTRVLVPKAWLIDKLSGK
ncbi:hypothetical protein [Tunturiibacter gelidoferens]|uniref:Helix-turn-helix domain-containing protein n=1 Tax=Tunturiibacter gelidiferens TaxID=3069689 RepID=A0A9X0QKI5_9BACT|nr:hypothetical protein [Edaphobacter lichenicola]MBB5331874.1 hypothetical protein [Edaphobacter lichenicola]